MLARLVVGAFLLTGMLSPAATPQRVYVVKWAGSETSPERRALIEQADSQLREELRRRGAVVDVQPGNRNAIVLTPSLELYPQALKLNLVGMRSGDKSILGTISTKASGSSRAAQLRAAVRRAVHEADQL